MEEIEDLDRAVCFAQRCYEDEGLHKHFRIQRVEYDHPGDAIRGVFREASPTREARHALAARVAQRNPQEFWQERLATLGILSTYDFGPTEDEQDEDEQEVYEVRPIIELLAPTPVADIILDGVRSTHNENVFAHWFNLGTEEHGFANDPPNDLKITEDGQLMYYYRQFRIWLPRTKDQLDSKVVHKVNGEPSSILQNLTFLTISRRSFVQGDFDAIMQNGQRLAALLVSILN